LILPYTVVIPTSGRSRLLEGVLNCLEQQTIPPDAVHVIDAAHDRAAAEICAAHSRLPLTHEHAQMPSAARQRNQGARKARTPIVVFCDDDMTFEAETFPRLVAALSDGSNALAGVAARMEGHTHAPPGRLLRRYYRWQAGYDDPHYGARLFGPAINCWPCYELQSETLIRSDWLNSALVAYRTHVFLEEQFPEFSGYSFMEDVHLSARIRRGHQLAFHRDARCVHHGESTAFRISRRDLVTMQWRNRALVCRTVLKTPESRLRVQLRAHRAFVAVHLLRHRPRDWRAELLALASLAP
jgi:glycosyltransferase involved in cell wall biosynthesis